MAIRGGLHNLVHTIPLQTCLQHGVEYLAMQAIEIAMIKMSEGKSWKSLSNENILV